MSMILWTKRLPPGIRRKAWGKMFGLFIQSGRKKIGFSVEEAAGRPPWTSAREAVERAVSRRQLRHAIDAGVLGSARALIVFLCQGAWEQ